MTANSIAEATKRFGPPETEPVLGKYNRGATGEGAREQFGLVHPDLLDETEALS